MLIMSIHMFFFICSANGATWSRRAGMCSVSYHLNMTPGKTFILSVIVDPDPPDPYIFPVSGSVQFPWIRIRIVLPGSGSASKLYGSATLVSISVVDPDPNWILIQKFCGSGYVFRIRIRTHTILKRQKASTDCQNMQLQNFFHMPLNFVPYC